MRRPLTDIPLKGCSFIRPDEFPENLNVRLVNAGHEIRRRGEPYDWDGAARGDDPMFIWQYTRAGRGRLRLEDREFDILPGDAMLLRIPEAHRYWLPSDSDQWAFLFITLAGSEMIRLGLDARRHLGPVARFSPDDAVVRHAASIITAGINGRIKSGFENSRRAYGFMMDLLAATSAFVKTPRDRAMERAREFCHANAGGAVDIDGMARAANLTRWHFSRVFRETCGLTPHQYIIETKMGLAKQLLRNTGYSIKEIGVQCGYGDTSYFCKVFRTLHGMSPGVFRSLGR